jgi:hypothetical protein
MPEPVMRTTLPARTTSAAKTQEMIAKRLRMRCEVSDDPFDFTRQSSPDWAKCVTSTCLTS